MKDTMLTQRDKLLSDMRRMVADAEELMRLSAGDASEEARALRERLQGSLSEAQRKLAELHEAATERLRAASHAADDYVHENPWRSIAIGTGMGLLIGMLIGRR